MIAFIIKRPVLVAMILLGLCLLGIVSYNRLPVELLPYAEMPMLIVQVGTPRDADPAYVEQQGVIPLESAIAGLEDIEEIESYIDRRRATIFVYYDQNANQKYAYLKLQECVAAAQSKMGDGFFATVWKIDTEQLSNQFMRFQARGEGDMDQIRKVVDEKVVPELEKIDGIANVEVYGGRRHSIEVFLDETTLRAHNLTTGQVSAKIAGSRANRQHLGQVTEGNRDFFVNMVTDYASTTDLEDVVLDDNGPLLLKHVATVADGGAEEESVSRINGLEAVSVSLMRDQQANLLSLSDETREAIDDLNDRLASDGINLVVQYNAAEPIEDNIDVIKMLALIGGILAVVVLWIFLRNLPLVLVVAAAIPISVLISMNLFYALDVTINTLTLVGVGIAIGMLIDNSVVVLENIHRLIARGKSPREAVVTGTGEVWRAVVAATLTTICVFLPFVFSDNFLIQLLGWQVGVAIISTLIVSLGIAFVLIPAFTYHFLTRTNSSHSADFRTVSQNNRLLQIYTLLLKSCLRFPARTVILGITVFFASVLLCLAVSINAPDEVQLDSFDLYVTLPSGTTLESSDTQAKEIDLRLVDIPEIEERLASITEESITLTFNLHDDYEDIEGHSLAEIKTSIMEPLDQAFPRLEFSYDEPTSNVRYRGGGFGGGGGGARGMGRRFERLLGIGSAEENVIIRGQDLDLLRAIADDIQYNIDQQETVNRSDLNISESQPEIDLLFDRLAMSYFGVNQSSIMSELSAFQSSISTGATLKLGTEDIDIVLKNEALEDKTADDLRCLEFPSSSGGTIPLSQVAQLLYTRGTSSIVRVNQEKEVTVSYSFASDVEDSKELLETARATIDGIVDDIALPSGVAVEVVHDETDLSDFYFLIFAGVILIYMILASVFESLLTPLAMMFTLPLATIGAFWGLILTGNSVFNSNAMVGFLILLGVVVNNGIILIDYSRVLRGRKYRLSRALMAAGQARVRPILITATTTMLAMLPLAMGKAEYVARIGAPFAITVIGGLTAGTLFTLLLVPTVSFGMQNALSWWQNLTMRIKAIQIVALAGGLWLISRHIDSFLWQAADTTALMIVIPALTYFSLTSLRRSSSVVIPQGEPLKIVVRNVVKLYDNYSRFITEWRKPERQEKRLGREGKPVGGGAFVSLMWQMPLYAFLFYFTFMYLEGWFYMLVFSVVFYAYTVNLLRPLLAPETPTEGISRRRRAGRVLYKLLFWGQPIVTLAWYYTVWDSPTWAIILAVLWYLATATYNTSQRLYRENVEINRITGRFKTIRKAFYRLVKITPLIGKKKQPFKALNQVSLEIESGMFGLVGPNGAGKTTLMRVICGILGQSQGTVTINDIDLDEKREELQGLIGYLPQEFGTYENMTAHQFLDYQALLKGLWEPEERKNIVDHAIASVHLEDNRNVRIKSFSGGMKQRVGIAQTLLHLPRILVVDEPTAGLDPRERIRFRNLLSELARDRIVIFSTHIIEDVSSSCNRLAVMADGEVKFLGTPKEMVESTRGRVWQAEVTEEMFEQLRATTRIVHHMRDGDLIRVRILSDNKPLPEAITVVPSLEDSYLWLLDGKN